MPNGQKGGGVNLSELLPSFDNDAQFGRERSEEVKGDPSLLEGFLRMFYDQDNITASLREKITENAGSVGQLVRTATSKVIGFSFFSFFLGERIHYS